jgi:MFS family permease
LPQKKFSKNLEKKKSFFSQSRDRVSRFSRLMNRVRVSRFVSLVAGFVLMLASGTIYLLPTYATDLRQALGLTQFEVGAIGAAMTAGTWVSLPGGLTLDRFGFRWTVLAGSCFLLIGYVALSLIVDGVLPNSVVLTAVFAYVVGMGSSFTYLSALKCTNSNFPVAVRGRAVGAMITAFGLSAGVFTLVSSVFFEGERTREVLSGYLLFLGFFLSAVAFVSLWAQRRPA